MAPWIYLYLPTALYVAVLGLGIHRYGKLDRGQRWVVGYEGLCIFTTVAIEVLRRFDLNSNVLVHLFAPIQTLMFGEMFAQNTLSPRPRSHLRWLSWGIAALWLLLLPLRDFETFRGIGFHLHTSLDMALALYALLTWSRSDRLPLTARPGFWLATGFLLGASLNLLLYASRDWLHDSLPHLASLMATFRACLVMFNHLLFAKALLCPPPTPPSSS